MDESLQVEAFLVGVRWFALPQIPSVTSVGGHRHRDGSVSLVICFHDADVPVLSAVPADDGAEPRVLGAVVSVSEAEEGIGVALGQLRGLSQYLTPSSPHVPDAVREDRASAYLDAVVIASVAEMYPVLVRGWRSRRPWLEGHGALLLNSVIDIDSVYL